MLAQNRRIYSLEDPTNPELIGEFEEAVEMEPDGHVDLEVIFSPEEAINYSGTITLTSGDNELRVGLNGSGIVDHEGGIAIITEPGRQMISSPFIPENGVIPEMFAELAGQVLIAKNFQGRFYLPVQFNNIADLDVVSRM